MKKITLLTFFLTSVVCFSQTNKQIIQTYFDNNYKLQFSKQDVSDWTIESEVVGKGTKITSCYIVQRYKGIEISNGQSNVSIKDGKIINFGDNFKSNISQKINTTSPSITVIEALERAYIDLGISIKANFSISKTQSLNKFKLNDGIQKAPISAKLLYQPTSDQKLKLAWAVQFYSPISDNLWDVRIDASNGKILEKNNLTISCSFENTSETNHDHKESFNFLRNFYKNNSFMPAKANIGTYRVIPYNYISPDHSPFQLITTSGNANASPKGWHDSNTLTGLDQALIFTDTRGNNVYAQVDSEGTNQSPSRGFSPDGGATLNFDFPYCGLTTDPTTCSSTATTNLFYMINSIHDILYQYGFDENSGNFQQENYGKGGVNDDHVFADAQDGYANATAPKLNNANFSTQADGYNPRMQMYLWNSGIQTNNFTINSTSLVGNYIATDNAFNPGYVSLPKSPNFLTGDLALYDDGSPDNTDACTAAINAAQLSGKIVVLRRGTCNFAVKVKNAQNAGAVGVIVVNNVEEGPRAMGGGDASITIPAVNITKAFGESIIAKMQTETVNVSLQNPKITYLDGDFDNGIISHEYGHGVSNRLIGGPNASGCMQNYEQMGEGWSDWFSLMLQLKTGDTGTDAKSVGTFVSNQLVTGSGIRAYKYSTDFTVNPRTLAYSNTPVPTISTDTGYRYKTGEVWASVLWDLTWAYIDKYGYNADVYAGTGGNNKVMQLVIDALKLQTCGTASFINSRDNIIAADQATTGGVDYCLITEVFRKRGMGLNASSGSYNDCNDQVEDFTAFPAGPNCGTLGINYFENEGMINIYPNPSNGQISIKIDQFFGKVNLQVLDLKGRVVYSQEDNDFKGEKTIDLTNLESGIYIVKVEGDKLNYTKKIVLN